MVAVLHCTIKEVFFLESVLEKVCVARYILSQFCSCCSYCFDTSFAELLKLAFNVWSSCLNVLNFFINIHYFYKWLIITTTVLSSHGPFSKYKWYIVKMSWEIHLENKIEFTLDSKIISFKSNLDQWKILKHITRSIFKILIIDNKYFG